MFRRCLWLLFASLPMAEAEGQIDYRNLDGGHPVGIEDAYPVERDALELQLSYSADRIGGRADRIVSPGITWGVLANLEAGLSLPLTIHDGGADGLAGIRGSLLYNLFTESSTLPALALAGDLHLPVGELAGRGARGTIGLLATRSMGRWRMHTNAAWGFADPRQPALAEPLARWRAGVGLDRTFFRGSWLLVGAVSAEELSRSSDTEWLGELGIRWQWNPNLVLDTGIRAQLNDRGHPFGLSIGLSRSFGVRGRPAASSESPATRPRPTRPPLLDSRSETSYYPGSFNWRFLSLYPEAARLFNAFDYGHAVLYERLLGGTSTDSVELDTRDFDFLTHDLLVRPPRLGVAEEAVAPSYSRLAWKAKQMFDWAHLLHRQIYDIYSDPSLSDSVRIVLVERVTDDYLVNRQLAFAPVPKAMELMDGAFYSKAFREEHPRFNGLIWSYHWLQVGLYEPLITASSSAERKAGVEAAVARFWQMLQDPPANMPQVMPMTAAIAPEFTRRHPRAAAIFDNLHMMHDIISDILASDSVPRSRKRFEIYAALAEFQDSNTNIVPPEHRNMMVEMMGGVDRMGGAATGLLQKRE